MSFALSVASEGSLEDIAVFGGVLFLELWKALFHVCLKQWNTAGQEEHSFNPIFLTRSAALDKAQGDLPKCDNDNETAGKLPKLQT